MKYACQMIVVAAMIGGLGFALFAQPATNSGAAPVPSPTLNAKNIQQAIKEIQSAAEPSAAVTAFANALSIDRRNPEIYNAYVRRMAELDVPKMAFTQAQLLVALDSTKGIGWGVIAFVEAQRGSPARGLSNIVLAVQYSGNEPFVLRTAGQLFAWYDANPKKADIPATLQTSIARVRPQLNKQAAYVDAYNQALAEFAGAGQQAPQVAAAGDQQAATQPAAPQQAEFANAADAQTYVTENYYYPDYGWSSPVWWPAWGGGWWGGGGGGGGHHGHHRHPLFDCNNGLSGQGGVVGTEGPAVGNVNNIQPRFDQNISTIGVGLISPTFNNAPSVAFGGGVVSPNVGTVGNANVARGLRTSRIDGGWRNTSGNRDNAQGRQGGGRQSAVTNSPRSGAALLATSPFIGSVRNAADVQGITGVGRSVGQARVNAVSSAGSRSGQSVMTRGNVTPMVGATGTLHGTTVGNNFTRTAQVSPMRSSIAPTFRATTPVFSGAAPAAVRGGGMRAGR